VWALKNGGYLANDRLVIWRNAAGKIHRDNGPAYVGRECAKWYNNDFFHRDDGPASVTESSQTWYQHGQRHREDGPARIWPEGLEEWWLKGIEYTDDTFTERVPCVYDD
jgi:hypothetical protein